MFSSKGQFRSNCRGKKFFACLSKFMSHTFFSCLNVVVFFQLLKPVNFFQPQGFAHIVFFFWNELPLFSVAVLHSFCSWHSPPIYTRQSKCLTSTSREYMVLESWDWNFILLTTIFSVMEGT